MASLGRIRLAWHLLRGHTVAYRLTIRNGGIDLRDRPRAWIDQVTIIGAPVAFRVDGPALLTPSADVPACRDEDPARPPSPPATPTPPNTRSEEG